MARRLAWWLLLWLGLAVPAAAQEPSAPLRERAAQVVALLRGEAQAEAMFSPAFLAAVPEAQLRAVTGQLVTQHGEARGLAGIEPRSDHAAAIAVDMDRAILRMNLALEPEPPHRITGLFVSGAEIRGDTLAALVEELGTLPGEISFAVAELGGAAPRILAGRQPDRALAIGSAFKLFILAELARQVAAGERRWDDTVALDRRSLPSGLLQDWPRGAPLTLHTLAALMISRSDNTATDLLLHALGRENVERMMTAIGVGAAARNRPFLATLEAFALKTAPPEAYAAWDAADESGRRRLLAELYGAIDPSGIDTARFAGPPLRIDSVEWFASTTDVARALDWLRVHGGDEALAILAISPGPGGPAMAGRHAYLGYKGGSEPGVINLSYLVRTRAGRWFAVAGSWNDPAAPVDNERFAALMTRALQLLPDS